MSDKIKRFQMPTIKKRLKELLKRRGMSSLTMCFGANEETISEWLTGKRAFPQSLMWNINYLYDSLLSEKGIFIHKCGHLMHWMPKDNPGAEYHRWECEKCGLANRTSQAPEKSQLRNRMERIASKAFPDESFKTTAMIDKLLVVVCAERGGCEREILYGYKKKWQKGYLQDLGYARGTTGPCRYCGKEKKRR